MANDDLCNGVPLNFTNYEQGAYLALYNPTERAFTSIVIPIVAIIGLIGNFAFLFTIARVPNLRSMTINYYLVTLAVIDAIFLTGVFLFFLWPYLTSEVSYAVPYDRCWLIFGIIFFTAQSSAGLVTVIAIERYFSICRPWMYRSISKKKRTVQIIAITLLIGLVLCILTTPAFGNNVTFCLTWPDTPMYENLPTSIQICLPYDFVFPFMVVIFNDVPLYIVLVVNVVLYWNIIKCLSSHNLATTKRSSEVRDQVARMLVVNGSVFFLCQVPARILNMGSNIALVTKHPWISPEGEEIFYLVIRLAFVVNAAVNPFIYSMMSSHYRQGMRDAFRCSSTFKVQATSPSESGETAPSQTLASTSI